jgi:predicted transcriptional regulator
MEILQMLWRDGAVTLSEAHRGLDRDIGYTTVQTRLNRLVAKGVIKRSKQRPAQYEAAVRREDVGARHLDLLLERVSGGSVVPLIAHLIKDPSLTRDELADLKKLVRQAERDIRRRSQENE